jgi:hypothetical protein
MKIKTMKILNLALFYVEAKAVEWGVIKDL